MKLLGIKDKLKKLITGRGGEKEHLPVLRALGNRVRQNVNTNYPTVEITLKESDALKWFKGTQREFGSDISLSPFELYGHIATSFDDEGFLEYGSWSVEVPYSSPGSGIDVTAYGRLQNMPEPPMKTAESHMVSVNLKFKSKKDTPSRREWMQALAKEKADWEAARKEDREHAQKGFEEECQDSKKQVNDFIDANAAMANETQRAWAGQVETVPMRPPLDQRIHNWDRDDMVVALMDEVFHSEEEDDKIDTGTDTDTDELPTEDDQ